MDLLVNARKTGRSTSCTASQAFAIYYAIVRPPVCLSVACNVRALYSGYWNFRQCFCAIWYHDHLWPFSKDFTEIIPGEPLRRGS